jgi:predicted ester cyclase
MLQADKARKALSEIPARQPKRLAGYRMLVAYKERLHLRETTIWLHALHGDAITGKTKREVRKELGLVKHDEDVTLSEYTGTDVTKIEVVVDDPARYGMPLTYLDGLSEIEFRASTQTVKDNAVVTRWEVAGTHSGVLLGVPPTGRSVVIAGITWLKFGEEETQPDGSRTVSATEAWSYWDLPALMEQIGATP